MSKTILIVDDSASMRSVVDMTLTQAGYTVISAVDGEDALAKLSGDKFHLIISDVNMPKMDGIEFVQKVKEHPKYRFTPIIMLTTEAGMDQKEKGRAAGVRAWFVKPFQREQLLEAVQKLIL